MVTKTPTYLERSKSSAISLSLYKTTDIHSRDPFFQIIPRGTGRLKSIYAQRPPEDIQVISLTYPILPLSSSTFRCAETCHAVTSKHHLHTSMGSFAPSHLGGTWLTSPRSCRHAPHRERSPSDSFLASLKTLLASKKSNFALQPQRLAFKMDDWYHWHVQRAWISTVRAVFCLARLSADPGRYEV
jgi:hypothetical protein